MSCSFVKTGLLKVAYCFTPTKSDLERFLFGCHVYGNVRIIKLCKIQHAIYPRPNVFEQILGANDRTASENEQLNFSESTYLISLQNT